MKHNRQQRFSGPMVPILVCVAVFAVTRASAENNAELTRIYEQDQVARSVENRKAGIFPTLQEERERRTTVMRLVSEGKIKSAEDYIRAAVILQHTSIIAHESGLKTSLGAENHILAFFLARRAHQLGHENGAHFMAWTYNYYLRSCGLDIETFGYKVVDGKIVPMDSTAPLEESVSECGFDPSRYFDEVNSIGASVNSNAS